MKPINFMKDRWRRIKGIISEDSLTKITDVATKFSIRNRLIFFFLLTSLGPMLIVGTISYISSKSAIDSKISKYSRKGISQTIQNLEIKLQGIENISKQFVAVSQYNTSIKEYVEAQDGMDAYMKGQSVNQLLQSIIFSNIPDASILFISLRDPSRYVTSVSLSGQFLETLQKSKLYKNIMNQRGKAVWSPIEMPENHEMMLVVGRTINERTNSEPLGVMIILMRENTLGSLIDGTAGFDTRDASNEFTMIVDHDGLILVDPDQEDITKNILKLLDNPRKIQPLLTGETETDNFLVKLKKQQVRIVGKKIGSRNWYILSVAKTSYLYFESNLVGLITLCLGIFFGIIAVSISLIIALSISKPLNQVIYSMRQAEKGDFTVRADIKRKDELGLLGISFDHMIDQIGTLLKETQKAIETVSKHSTVLDESADQSAKAAESVAVAMEEITKGTMEQTNEAEKSSMTMNDLASQIEVVVSKAGEVEQILGSTRELSLKSREAVEQLIQKTNETDQITRTIIENIIDLRMSAERIRQITEVITGIAEQTNLLGLNASIEAARAGETGQGFAVVSEEINKLALQSRDAAKTINGILQEIQNKTEISTKTAESARLIMEEQRIAVNLTQQAFAEITEATGNIIARIIFMNNLINNINKSKEHTVQSIMSISSISEETAASSEEVSASSEEQTALADQVRMLAQELRNKAQELAGVIQRFQV